MVVHLLQISKDKFYRLHACSPKKFPVLPHTLLAIKKVSDVPILMHTALMLHIIGIQCSFFMNKSDGVLESPTPPNLSALILYIVNLFKNAIELFAHQLRVHTEDALHAQVCIPFFSKIQLVLDFLIQSEPVSSFHFAQSTQLCSMRDLLAFMVQLHLDIYSNQDCWTNSQQAHRPVPLEGEDTSVPCLCNHTSHTMSLRHISIPAPAAPAAQMN